MSTVVLAAGIGTRMLSTLPPSHLYGLVVVIVLIAILERWRYPVKTGSSQS